MRNTLNTALDGRYNVDHEIGRGGMATVYLARDVRHNRKVALKVLNPELGAVLGVERFLAEIEVTANLQHPNLLPLFDSGEVNGLLFYVMPYVEGESLRARLEREKQLPIEEAVRVASAIASALDYAHRHHVIHRDLKPENILLQDGQPLVADFGIALAVSRAGGSRITQTGLSLGTPQYMSPEQATADRTVDGRTDIYSLAAITYEMLAGDPPYVASTSQAILAKMLTERPASLRIGRPSVPPHVEAAVIRALEKLPADRFATAREFANTLEGRTTTSATVPAAAGMRPSATRTGRAREIVAWSLAGLLAIWAGWSALSRPEVAEAPVIRAHLDLPPGTRINDVITGSTIAVSPKGDLIAFTSMSINGFRVYVRRVNEIAARELTDAVGRNITFSPDGRWLAYTEGNVLRKIRVDGGQPETLGTSGGTVPYGMTWGPNDTLYIGSFNGLYAVPASGGEPVLLADPADSAASRVGRRWPRLLPGNQAIVFSSGSSSSASPQLSVFTLATRTAVSFDVLAAMTLGVLGDQLVYISPAGGLMAVRWDESGNRPVGDPVQLDEGLLVDPSAGAKASLSATGTLAFLKGRAQYQPVLARVGGAEGTASTPMIREPGTYSTPRFSPDGRQVAMTVFSANATDIWIYDLGRNTFTRLTTEGANIRPEWTSDGKHIIFVGTRNNKTAIWRQPADGSGPAELLYEPEVEPFEAIMSPDLQWLVIRTAPGAKYSRDILAVPMTGDRTPIPLVTSPNSETIPRLSPDGKWLAYQSNETGRFEIYVRPFPATGPRTAVSDKGGSEPIWGRSGRTMYYRGSLGEVVEVEVTTGASLSIGQRKVVLTGEYLTDASHPNYDVAPDGRFLMLRRAGAEAQTIVVHNWGRELREKTGPRR